jgi:hypothetical protein
MTHLPLVIEQVPVRDAGEDNTQLVKAAGIKVN